MKYLMKNVLLRYLVNAMQNQVRSINRVSAIDRSITIDVLAMPAAGHLCCRLLIAVSVL